MIFKLFVLTLAILHVQASEDVEDTEVAEKSRISKRINVKKKSNCFLLMLFFSLQCYLFFKLSGFQMMFAQVQQEMVPVLQRKIFLKIVCSKVSYFLERYGIDAIYQ